MCRGTLYTKNKYTNRQKHRCTESQTHRKQKYRNRNTQKYADAESVLPEAMYTESAFRREELEGSGGEKQPEEGMESAEILRNICEKDVTLFRTAHSKDLNSVSWALRTLVEREPETFFRYL